jgi:hypothetical protein
MSKLKYCNFGLALFAATFSGGGARAQSTSAFENGESLLMLCESGPPKGLPIQMGMCIGYVTAISDAHSYPLSIGGHRICMPKRPIARGEVLDIVVKWLRNNPRERHHAAPYLVSKALAETFPCIGSQ